VLLSVHYGRATKEHLRLTAAALDAVHARTLGVVLNIVPPSAATASGSGYGYGYGYGADVTPGHKHSPRTS
jgi:Mrp family chromosome partitioning ATPase